MRFFPVALAVILGLALLAACGGEDEESDEEQGAATPTAAAPAAVNASATGTPRGGATGTPRAGTTATPEEGTPSPSPTGDSAREVGCEFPSDIESFRYTMTMKANLPSTPEGETPESEEPLGDFLGTLSGLMGDMKMEGAVIVPDRSSMEMTVGGHEFGSFIQIGSQSWMKVAGLTDWTEQPSSEDSEFLFSPLDFCETTEEDLSSALSGLEGEEETVNGIEAVHYHLDKADLTLLKEFLGGTEDLGLPDEFNMDVWLAEDGDWPVRMSFEAGGEDDEGEALTFEILVEFKDFNDSSIKIEPPT
jgi:hypothetical protein